MHKTSIHFVCLLAIVFAFVWVPTHSYAGSARNNVVATATAEIGKPYGWGGKGPDSFDCSGLMYFAYNQNSITIPSNVHDQWVHMSPLATYIQPGDLVFFKVDNRDVGHVGMLLDHNNDGRLDMIHATSPSVEIVYDLYGSPWGQAIVGYRTGFY